MKTDVRALLVTSNAHFRLSNFSSEIVLLMRECGKTIYSRPGYRRQGDACALPILIIRNIIAFTLQQRLHERTSMLCYK